MVDVGVEEDEGRNGHPLPVSSEPEAVGGAQHVFKLWRGLSSLFKMLHKGGGGVKATQPGKSHKMAENVPI